MHKAYSNIINLSLSVREFFILEFLIGSWKEDKRIQTRDGHFRKVRGAERSEHKAC